MNRDQANEAVLEVSLVLLWARPPYEPKGIVKWALWTAEAAVTAAEAFRGARRLTTPCNHFRR